MSPPIFHLPFVQVVRYWYYLLYCTVSPLAFVILKLAESIPSDSRIPNSPRCCCCCANPLFVLFLYGESSNNMGMVSFRDDGIRTTDAPGKVGRAPRWFGSRMAMMKDNRRDSLEPQVSGRRRLTRKSSNCSQDYCGTADPAPATKGSKGSKPGGRRIIRAVARILARAKNARENKYISGLTEPASPVSEKLSRTTSTDSSHETDPEGDTAEESTTSSSRPRVSFNSEVTVRY